MDGATERRVGSPGGLGDGNGGDGVFEGETDWLHNDMLRHIRYVVRHGATIESLEIVFQKFTVPWPQYICSCSCAWGPRRADLPTAACQSSGGPCSGFWEVLAGPSCSSSPALSSSSTTAPTPAKRTGTPTNPPSSASSRSRRCLHWVPGHSVEGAGIEVGQDGSRVPRRGHGHPRLAVLDAGRLGPHLGPRPPSTRSRRPRLAPRFPFATGHNSAHGPLCHFILEFRDLYMRGEMHSFLFGLHALVLVSFAQLPWQDARSVLVEQEAMFAHWKREIEVPCHP